MGAESRPLMLRMIVGGLLIALVRAYQLTLRPFLGRQCRFVPTCSDYAIDALRTHRPLKALRLTARRLGRCHPFCEGGYDPVPNDEPDTNQKANKSSDRRL